MSEHRGPRRLDEASVDQFLETARWGSLCIDEGGNGLGAFPVRVVGADRASIAVVPADGAALATLPNGVAACLVADEFETYEGIRGVIVQGALDRLPQGGGERLVLRVARRIGFSFAGTLPAALDGGRDAGDDGATMTAENVDREVG